MCGRISQARIDEIDDKRIGLDPGQIPLLDWTPRYNIPPGANAFTVRTDPHTARPIPAVMRWGLLPHWARDPKLGYRTFNARVETAASKPAFRNAFRRRCRCIVPVDGWYEWRTEPQGKQPYFVHTPDNAVLLAGLWETWRPSTDPHARALETFTVLTTTATAELEPLHPRMPVVLDIEHASAWLAGEDLPIPPDADPAFSFAPVTRALNHASHDGPNCHQPLNESRN